MHSLCINKIFIYYPAYRRSYLHMYMLVTYNIKETLFDKNKKTKNEENPLLSIETPTDRDLNTIGNG